MRHKPALLKSAAEVADGSVQQDGTPFESLSFKKKALSTMELVKHLDSHKQWCSLNLDLMFIFRRRELLEQQCWSLYQLTLVVGGSRTLCYSLVFFMIAAVQHLCLQCLCANVGGECGEVTLHVRCEPETA